MLQPYTIEEHQHRLAVWAAASAAFRGLKGKRVERCADLLNAAGIDANFGVSQSGDDEVTFDKRHLELRESIVAASRLKGSPLTHGRAAKVLNIYFKVRFVCGPDHTDKRIKLIHPPVDRMLLTELAGKDIGGKRKDWTHYRDGGWSKFSSDNYEAVIRILRVAINGEPMWTLERHWSGN